MVRLPGPPTHPPCRDPARRPTHHDPVHQPSTHPFIVFLHSTTTSPRSSIRGPQDPSSLWAFRNPAKLLWRLDGLEGSRGPFARPAHVGSFRDNAIAIFTKGNHEGLLKRTSSLLILPCAPTFPDDLIQDDLRRTTRFLTFEILGEHDGLIAFSVPKASPLAQFWKALCVRRRAFHLRASVSRTTKGLCIRRRALRPPSRPPKGSSVSITTKGN